MLKITAPLPKAKSGDKMTFSLKIQPQMADEESVRSCPACLSQEFSLWRKSKITTALTSRDVKITDMRYGTTLTLMRCHDCSFIFAADAIGHNLTELYETMEDEEYLISEPSRRKQFHQLLVLTEKCAPKAHTVLDIGAGIGTMISACRDRGYEATGIEPSKYLVNQALKIHDVTIIASGIETTTFKQSSFDIIFLTDVIEHVADPGSLIAKCKNLLKSNGVLVITTPDVQSLTARTLGRMWWHFRLAHVSYFSDKTIATLLNRYSLSIETKSFASWYLPASYLAKRICALVGLPEKLANDITNWAFDFTVPLSLFDSKIYFVRHSCDIQQSNSRKNKALSHLREHIKVMRLDYWIKNIFLAPGIILAYGLYGIEITNSKIGNIAIGLICTVLIASSNYVINELLDAKTDVFHPQKKSRPFAAGRLSKTAGYSQWILLGTTGIVLGTYISIPFTISLMSLWIMGCIYNIPPVRSKDKPYTDVITEAINNPIRLHIGWFMLAEKSLPPLSLSMAYWMIGCYFMALKRFAELDAFETTSQAIAYRKSFSYYTRNRLLVAAVTFLSASTLFLGAFSVRYKFELLLCFPAMAWACGIYLGISLQPNSAASSPEKLYKEKSLVAALTVVTALGFLLLQADLPWLIEIFAPHSHLGH
jgi:decaprenyl-phosphate phosphoribosyltransferase